MKRLDVAVHEKGIAESRNIASGLIKSGAIEVNGSICLKPSQPISDDDVVILKGELPKYVGRGGYKLETAVRAFNLDFTGMTCLDVGASTGGFTDCMLQFGASRVYAVDVGKSQLHHKLKDDLRVISLEETDIRIASIDEKIDFITIDVSFISLKLILPEIKRFIMPLTRVVALIKPQFEVGKKHLKNGILKDEKERLKILRDMEVFIDSLGCQSIGAIPSEIKGTDGNQEYIIYFASRRNSNESCDMLQS